MNSNKGVAIVQFKQVKFNCKAIAKDEFPEACLMVVDLMLVECCVRDSSGILCPERVKDATE